MALFKNKGIETQEARLGWILVSPTALIVFGLIIFPAFFSIWISFHDVSLKNLDDVFHADFVGLKNYGDVFKDFAFKFQNIVSFKLTEQSLENLRNEGIPDTALEALTSLKEQKFTKEDDFLDAIKKQIGQEQVVQYKDQLLKHAKSRVIIWGAALTSVIYSFSATALTLIVGLFAALLLNQPFRARGLARSIFLFPYVAPIVSVAFVWKWMLDPRPSGVLNDILMRLGVIDLPKAYLATRGLALLLVIIFQAWRYFPFAMLMILARLQAIDKTLYEAADVDGASRWRQFWHITLPELHYILGAIFLLRLTWTFNKFDDIFLLTSGGYGTKVLPVLTYEFCFKMNYFGRGAATAMILLVILVVFMVFYVKFVMRNTEEG